MRKWAKAVKKIKNELSIGIVPAKHHCAGLGATGNGFRNILGQSKAVREEMKQ
jgi:hypothetical protein